MLDFRLNQYILQKNAGLQLCTFTLHYLKTKRQLEKYKITNKENY